MEATLIGVGEVGKVLLRGANASRVVHVVRRADPFVMAETGPIAVAVREDDLGPLVEKLRPFAERAVFLQNGLVDDVLAPLGETTRALVWFTAKGTTFAELAPTVVHGPMAEPFARWLRDAGIDARIEPNLALFRLDLAKKLAWNNVAGLGPFVRGTTLGDYLDRYADEARAIVDETMRVCAARWGIPTEQDATLALVRSTIGPIAALRGGNKALAFRNGAIVRLGEELGVPTPVNRALLEQSTAR